jgi:hypothetical protein
VNVHPEVLDLAKFLDLLGREEELRHVTEVLGDGPEDLAGIDITLVPFQKFLGSGDILSDGLLGQDVLASEQCFLNELRLNQNRKAVGVES